MTNKLAISEFFAERYEKQIGPGWRNMEDLARYREMARQDVAGEEWATMTTKARDTRTVYQELLTIDYTMELILVELVRYDEDLYRALVDSGASISRKGQTGRVALSPEALHQYY